MVDVGDESEVVRALHEVVTCHGRLDVLVNNAGLARHGPVHRLDTADLDLMWRVNVRATVLLCREAFRTMIPQRGGQVVNVVSTAGLRGEPGESAYSATKFAVRGFSEGIAEKGRLHGIRVHAVFPAGVDTPFWSEASATSLPREALDSFLRPRTSPPPSSPRSPRRRTCRRRWRWCVRCDADLDHIRRRMARFETGAGA